MAKAQARTKARAKARTRVSPPMAKRGRACQHLLWVLAPRSTVCAPAMPLIYLRGAPLRHLAKPAQGDFTHVCAAGARTQRRIQLTTRSDYPMIPMGVHRTTTFPFLRCMNLLPQFCPAHRPSAVKSIKPIPIFLALLPLLRWFSIPVRTILILLCIRRRQTRRHPNSLKFSIPKQVQTLRTIVPRLL